MADVECRVTELIVETRSADSRRIGGYAAKFGKVSRNLGGFVETVERSFFNKSRGDGWPDVVARFNHDPNMLLATTRSGTLTLNVDSEGLDYELDLPESRRDVYELVQRGDVYQSSFSFLTMTVQDEWRSSDQGYPLRILHSAQLTDVSPLGQTAAYPDATAGLRSLAKHFDADFEEVRTLAAKDDLRRFFHKTVDGGAPKRLQGTEALVAVLGSNPDPWADKE